MRKIKSYSVQLPYNTEKYEIDKEPEGHDVPKDVIVNNIHYVFDSIHIDLSDGTAIQFNDKVPSRVEYDKEDYRWNY